MSGFLNAACGAVAFIAMLVGLAWLMFKAESSWKDYRYYKMKRERHE